MIFGTIVVCGGGCYGGYYVRQLARARTAGAVQLERIVVVDKDPACAVAMLIAAIQRDDLAAVAQHGWRMRRADATRRDTEAVAEYRGLPIAFEESAWEPFFNQWFARAIAAPDNASHDAVVPSPLMPHLLSDWVESRVRAHRPGATVQRVPMSVNMETPWRRDSPDLAQYASFATWMCPINCIEPPRCPETRGVRDWTMPAAVRNAVDEASRVGTAYDVVALFRTTHRAYGVGMFDAADALAADAAIASVATRPQLRLLVASVSHCHGALSALASHLGGTTAEMAADRSDPAHGARRLP
jgi:hypothetical protein